MQQSLPEGLKQAVHQLVHDYPQEYTRMYEAMTMDELKDALAPNGECAYKIRIPGIGGMIIFVRTSENIAVTNIRAGDKEYYEWQQLWDSAKEYFAMGGTAKESWANVFNEPFPEAEKPQEHNVQQSSKPESKKEVKKESKVKTPAPKPQPKPEPVETEEQLLGQDNIMNHPEYLPEDMNEEKPEVLTGEVEDVVPEASNADNNNVQQSSDEIAPVQLTVTDKHVIAGYKSGIKATAHVIQSLKLQMLLHHLNHSRF